MKKFFTILFVALGMVFVVQLLGMIYFYVVDPYNLKPIILRMMTSTSTSIPVPEGKTLDSQPEALSGTVVSDVEADTESEKPAVSVEQAAALESVGLAPESALNFTPAELQCFETKLGKERVAEIKAGAVPSMVEFGIASECVQ